MRSVIRLRSSTVATAALLPSEREHARSAKVGGPKIPASEAQRKRAKRTGLIFFIAPSRFSFGKIRAGRCAARPNRSQTLLHVLSDPIDWTANQPARLSSAAIAAHSSYC
jgi:hypothetical protein